MSKQIKSPPILLIDRDLIVVFALKIALIFFLVEEEVLLGRVIRPDVLDGFVDFAVVFEFLKILYNFFRSSGTVCIVNEFFFGCGPGSIVQAAGKFKCPVHSDEN